MESTKFWTGFEKCSVDSNQIAGAVAGALQLGVLGSLVGVAMSMDDNKKDAEKLLLHAKKHKDNVSAKKFFNEHKHLLPDNSIILTRSDLHKKVDKSMKLDEMEIWKALRSATEGNAAAIMPSSMTDTLFKHTPELKGKYIVLSDDNIHPAVVAHEMGHVIDFASVAKKNLFGRFASHFRSGVAVEEAGWDNAPGDKSKYNEKKELALGTYKRTQKYTRIGGLAGLLIGAGIGAVAGKRSN